MRMVTLDERPLARVIFSEDLASRASASTAAPRHRDGVRAWTRSARTTSIERVARLSKSARQTLEVMATGIRLQRIALHRRFQRHPRTRSRGACAPDLLAASSGIEAEVVARATPIDFGEIGEIPVARVEELLAMKILSMTERRLEDRIDAVNLVLLNGDLDLDVVRENLVEIARCGFHRDQDLLAKLAAILEDAAAH